MDRAPVGLFYAGVQRIAGKLSPVTHPETHPVTHLSRMPFCLSRTLCTTPPIPPPVPSTTGVLRNRRAVWFVFRGSTNWIDNATGRADSASLPPKKSCSFCWRKDAAGNSQQFCLTGHFSEEIHFFGLNQIAYLVVCELIKPVLLTFIGYRVYRVRTVSAVRAEWRSGVWGG